jgi:hypothetical protein
VPACALVLALGCAQNKLEKPTSSEPACCGAPGARVLARGDQVVVEQTAAEFFEGRVVAVDSEKLRVQAPGKPRSLMVESSDAYPLPPAKHRFEAGQFAVCRAGRLRWVGCRVQAVQGQAISVQDVEGRPLRLSPAEVLAPSPVTELNLRRHFERIRTRAAFARAVERAGAPRAPKGWRAAPRERVLAQRDSSWYSARIHEIEKSGLRVRWDADQQISEVSAESVVPQPPYVGELGRGDFALMELPGGLQPWQPVQVRAVIGADLKVVDIDGEMHSVSRRDVVPLRGEIR